MVEKKNMNLQEHGSLIPSTYYEILAKASQELYSDYFSDLTRKRQSYLLLCSVISILVAFAFIEPTGGSFIVDFIIPSNLEISKVVAGILSLYFLIIYLGGVLQDKKAYDLRVQPTIIELNGISMKIAEEIYNVEQESQNEFKKNIEETLKKAFGDFYQNQSDENAQRLSKAIGRFSVLQNRHENELASLYQKYEELRGKRAWNSFVELTQTVNQIRTVYGQIWKQEREYLKNFHHDLKLPIDFENENKADRERVDFVIKSIKEFKFYRNLKVVFEILFPVGLALYAILVNLIVSL